MLQTDRDRLNESYMALERKAELYDKLSRGQYDDDEEQYNVDFLSKGFLTDEIGAAGSSGRQFIDVTRPIDTSAMAAKTSGVVGITTVHCCAANSLVISCTTLYYRMQRPVQTVLYSTRGGLTYIRVPGMVCLCSASYAQPAHAQLACVAASSCATSQG